MKKITILLFALIGFTATAQFAEIGMIGDALTGWDDDVDMTTTDGVTYTLEEYVFNSGSAKFRQDDAWTNNWGGSDFPSGTAVFNADNIPVVAGTYTVTFNLETLAYNFESTVTFPNIGMIGTAVNDGADEDENLFTTDGENYFINAFTFSDGILHFRQDDDELTNWGATDFPTGTATQDGGDIPVVGGTYNVNINIATGAYSFDYLTISMIGAFNDWGADEDLTTTDGENYTLDSFVVAEDGELKFRQNHDWGTSWGVAEFPSGTATIGGNNIPAIAGTYSVVFNRLTGEFTFGNVVGVEDFTSNANLVSIYPNVTNNSFAINRVATGIEIYNEIGKLIQVFNGNFNANQSFDISSLNAGLYFVQIKTATSSNVQRLIVK